MRWLDRLRYFCRAVCQRERIDRELDEELSAWVEELSARYQRRGHDAVTARRLALADLGSLERVRDEVRSTRPASQVEGMMRDVQFAWRSLRRTPGFTAAVVLTFALGIGANTAIFSVVHALLIAPLPYRDASRLVFVWTDMSSSGYPRAPLSGPELMDLRERSTLFDGFGAIWANTTTLTGDGEPEQLRIGLVTSNFFAVLGATAALGRTFDETDETQPPGILISWALFERRFGSDRAVVGRQVQVNGQSVRVIGVMPETFRLLMPPEASVPDDLQAWQLLRGSGLARGLRGQLFLRVIGRMKPGVTVEHGRQEIAGIADRISKEFTEYGGAGRQFVTVGLQTDGVREIRPALLALFAGVGLLLVIACVNVTNLLIARSVARAREIGIRSTLGASSWRIARQCLAEGVVVAGLGAAVGLVAGWMGLRVLLLGRPAALARLGLAEINTTVLLFTCAVAFFWGLLCSLAPMRGMLRMTWQAALQRDGQRVVGGLHAGTRSTLVVAEMALGVVLLVGAGLLVRTFIAIQHIDPGFRSDNMVTFRLSVPFSRYRPPASNVLVQQIHDAIRAVPGVTGVGAISHLPYDDLPNWGGPYLTQAGADDSTAASADYRAVTPGLLEELGVTLIEGRLPTPADAAGGERVAVIDDVLARRAWPGVSALGRTILADPGSSGHPTASVTVVGVVRHLRLRSLVEDLREQVYFPADQVLRNPLAYVVQTTGNSGDLVPAIRAAIARIDPQIPIYDVRPFDSYVRDAMAGRRFTMTLAACFAVLAMLLACVGVYGVMAYSVTRRRSEFGVRLALGAVPSQLGIAVLREGSILAALGLTIGAGVAYGVARLLRSQLVGVTPADPVTYLVVIALLAFIFMLACWLPARRAMRSSPLEALRSE